MVKHHLSLKDLKSPDKLFKAMLAFVGYLKHNVKLLLTIAGIIVLLTALTVMYNHIKDKRENDALGKLYIAEKSIEKLETGKNDEIIKILEKTVSELSESDISAEANYKLAEAYYKAQQWDSAIKYYNEAVNKSEGIFKSISLFGFSYAYEMKKDYKSALTEFTKLKDFKETVYRAVAMLGIARCYSMLGETANAAKEYDQIIISYPDSDSARMAYVGKSKLVSK